MKNPPSIAMGGRLLFVLVGALINHSGITGFGVIAVFAGVGLQLYYLYNK